MRFLKTSCRYVLTSSSPLLNLLSNFEMTTLILAQRQQTRDPNRKVYTPPFARSYHGFTLSRLDMMTPNLECGGRTSRLIADKSSLRASLPETHFDLTVVALIRFKVSRIWGWEIVRTSVKCHPMINRKETKNGPTVSELLSFVTLSN